MTQIVTIIAKMSKPAKIWLNSDLDLYVVHASPQTLQIVDPKNGGSSFLDLPPKNIISFPSSVKIVTFSSDGGEMAVGLESGSIVRINFQDFNLNYLPKNHSGPITCLTYYNNSKIASCAENDNRIAIHNLITDKTKFGKTKNKNITNALSWIQENLLVSAGMDGMIHFWDTEKVKVSNSYEGHDNSISVLSTGTSNLLFFTGDIKGIIKIWQFRETNKNNNLNFLGLFTGHTSAIHEMIINKSEDILLTVNIDGNFRLFDLLNIKKESELIYLPTNDSCYDLVWSTEFGTFYSIHISGTIKLWRNFQLQAIHDVSTKFSKKLVEINQKIIELPEWIRNANLSVIQVDQLNVLEQEMQITEKFFSKSPSEQFRNPFWLLDNYIDSIESLEAIENNIKENIVKLRQKMQEILAQAKQKKVDYDRLAIEASNYLKKMSQGGSIKISVNRLSDYFQISLDDMLTILTQIEQNKAVEGVLKRELTGNYWQMIEKNSDPQLLDSTDSFILCFYCGSKYKSAKYCPSCNKKTKKCLVCKNVIAKNQAVIVCPHCQTNFHFACYESKVKLFSRCPTCRAIVNIEAIKQKLNIQEKQTKNISSSLLRMVAVGQQQMHPEEKENDEDDDIFDF